MGEIQTSTLWIIVGLCLFKAFIVLDKMQQTYDTDMKMFKQRHWGTDLHSLLAAAQQARVRQLQRLFGLRTLLSVVLQAAEFTFVDGERLQRLLWTQTALQRQQADKHWKRAVNVIQRSQTGSRYVLPQVWSSPSRTAGPWCGSPPRGPPARSSSGGWPPAAGWPCLCASWCRWRRPIRPRCYRCRARTEGTGSAASPADAGRYGTAAGTRGFNDASSTSFY